MLGQIAFPMPHILLYIDDHLKNSVAIIMHFYCVRGLWIRPLFVWANSVHWKKKEQPAHCDEILFLNASLV